MSLLLLIPQGQKRGIPNFHRFPGISISRAVKVILSKIVFDFTAGRLSENVKILPLGGSMTFVCNKGAQEGGL